MEVLHGAHLWVRCACPSGHFCRAGETLFPGISCYDKIAVVRLYGLCKPCNFCCVRHFPATRLHCGPRPTLVLRMRRARDFHRPSHWEGSLRPARPCVTSTLTVDDCGFMFHPCTWYFPCLLCTKGPFHWFPIQP